MSDERIQDLDLVPLISPQDRLVLEHDGKAYALSGQTLINWVTAAADGHGGIRDIKLTNRDGLIDTYTITYADATSTAFQLHNGESGVHYGSDTPSDTQDVWIDPEGEPTDLSQFNTLQERTVEVLTLGPELILDNAVLGTGWAGALASGYTFTKGKYGELSFPTATEKGENYLLQFHVDPVLMDVVSVAFGGMFLNLTYNGRNDVLIPLTSDGGPLKFSPTMLSNFTVSKISLKKILPAGSEGEKKSLSVYSYTTPDHDRNLGYWNTILGTDTMPLATASTRTVCIGYQCMSKLEGGNRNICVGTYAMSQAKGGERNVSIGPDSMFSVKRANNCIAVGMSAMEKGRYVEKNVAIGPYTMSGSDESYAKENTVIGAEAGNKLTGRGNTFLGFQAGWYVAASQNNTCIGSNAYGQATGDNNTCLGHGSGFADGVSDSIAIGSGVAADKSGQIKIGDSGASEVIVAGKRILFQSDGTVRWEAV